MWLFNQPSSSARAALVYITLGALTVVWTCVWFLYLYNHPPESAAVYYWCGGLLVSGATVIGIGLGIGQIGHSARRADLPPQQVVSATPPETPADAVAVPPPASTVVVAPPAVPRESVPRPPVEDRARASGLPS